MPELHTAPALSRLCGIFSGNVGTVGLVVIGVPGFGFLGGGWCFNFGSAMVGCGLYCGLWVVAGTGFSVGTLGGSGSPVVGFSLLRFVGGRFSLGLDIVGFGWYFLLGVGLRGGCGLGWVGFRGVWVGLGVM